LTDTWRQVIETAEYAVASHGVVDEAAFLELVDDLDLTNADDGERDYLAVLLDVLGLRDEAVRVLRASSSDVDGGSSHDAARRNLEGMLAARNGHYSRALELFSEALNAAERDTPLRTRVLANLAAVSMRAGQTAQAIAWGNEAQRGRSRANEPAVDVLLASVQAEIASIQDDAAGLRVAATALSEASESKIAELGSDHPRALTAVANMAAVEFELAHTEDLPARRQQAIAVLDIVSRRLAAELGADHLQALISMANLGWAEVQLAQAEGSARNLGAAVALLEAVSERATSALGPQHPLARRVAENLAISRPPLELAQALDRGRVADRSGAGSPPGSAVSRATTSPSASAVFRNREEELEMVLRSVTISSGPHFWLVIAPPQFGKSWFLDQFSTFLLSGHSEWVIRRTDLAMESPDLRTNAAGVLGRLFNLPTEVTDDWAIREIARQAARSRRPQLCLLDSADLLDAEAAAELRSSLSQIYQMLEGIGRREIRLAVVVASRFGDPWRGVTPYPRLRPLQLAEVSTNVVDLALRALALDTGRVIDDAAMRRLAVLVHRVTEGSPPLLSRCLQWIQEQDWVEIDRLENQDTFEQIGGTYIRDELLSQRSLMPGGQAPSDDALEALMQAIRVLVPYRILTQSHLRHYFETDTALRWALDRAQWSTEDAWTAINGTALLKRPLNEPWLEIQPTIRRLLFRYYYKSEDQRVTAHNAARKFMEGWTGGQTGKEQAVGLVECLWHEGVALSLQHPAEMNYGLQVSARILSGALRLSPAYTVQELRAYAAELMRDDEEFRETVSGAGGLFRKLLDVTLEPLSES
jgi:tetratricopeptide (TPR) repeat protein